MRTDKKTKKHTGDAAGDSIFGDAETEELAPPKIDNVVKNAKEAIAAQEQARKPKKPANACGCW